MKNLLLITILFALLFIPACSSKPQPATQPQPIQIAPETPSPAQSKPKIVAFGDSLTAGFGLSAAESYPSLLQDRLKRDGYDYEVVNAGVSGDTSAGGLRRIDWALEGDVKILILELGANDILRGQSLKLMKENLSMIIGRAKAKNVQVLLCGMYSPTSAGPDYQKEVIETYKSLAEEHQVTFMPFFLEGVGGVDKLNQNDGIHPNIEGTKIVTENVYKALLPLLK